MIAADSSERTAQQCPQDFKLFLLARKRYRLIKMFGPAEFADMRFLNLKNNMRKPYHGVLPFRCSHLYNERKTVSVDMNLFFRFSGLINRPNMRNLVTGGYGPCLGTVDHRGRYLVLEHIACCRAREGQVTCPRVTNRVVRAQVGQGTRPRVTPVPKKPDREIDALSDLFG